MKLIWQLYNLHFKHPFGVSGNTRSQTPTVFVRLEEDGFYGYGEACLPAYLGETIEATTVFFEAAKPLLQNGNAVSSNELFAAIDKLSAGNNAAKAAINIAFNDFKAKQAGKTFRGWKGLPEKQAVPTSFTIGIDSEEKITQKIKESERFEVLKVKAGTSDDKKLISLVRSLTNKPLYVDVNQGWKNKEQAQALEMLEWMSTKNVVLVEQPLPKEMKEEMKWLTARSPILTVADESIKRLTDLQQMDGAFGGINIKLMKCTGLDEAIEMIDFCKRNNIKILLGCMAESSCGTTAMAQLMGFADHVDLDAPQLYVNDPFEGIKYKDGKIYLNDLPGIGAKPINIAF